MISEAAIWTVLNEVIHPSFGLSLVALGMVQAVQVSTSAVWVDLVMNCPGCPAAEAALASANQRLRAIEGVQAVTLSLVPKAWRAPWQGAESLV
jgi:metal-sulfur cluster biosynthetic enzyme